MKQHPMDTFARELRGALNAGAFAHCSQIELSDGVTVNSERMARIVLVDFERFVAGTADGRFPDDQVVQLFDDLKRLHSFVLARA
jgi:hypothetical protein